MKTSYSIKNHHELLYCEADSNYTTLHYRNGNTQLVTQTLKRVQDHLPDTLYIRIHHSYLVNRKFIHRIAKDRTEIELMGGRLLPISRRKRTQLQTLI